jgi:biotin carboxylase
MTVLLLATTTGYQIRSFGAAAERLAVRLLLASDRCDRLDDPWFDAAIPVRFHQPDASLQAVVAALADRRPDGVIAVGDRPTLLAARVAEAFGLPGNPPHAAAVSRNKLETRRALHAAGLLTPAFRMVPIDADAATLAGETTYPSVIKPLALSASRGVMRVDDPQSFAAAWTRLRRLLSAPDIRLERDAIHGQALIERFIPGAEYAIEGVLTRGVFTPFAIFDKPDPLDGPFFEETIYVTPSRETPGTQAAIVAAIAAAARALGLRHGPIHAECRVGGAGVFVLEVAARPIGGLCAKALRFAGGQALEEVLLRHAIGADVSTIERESCASGVMMIPIPRRGVLRGVDGIDQARAVDGIEEVTITARPEAVLVPLPEGHSYLGFIFARGARPEDAERALREAHARLAFTIEREVSVLR